MEAELNEEGTPHAVYHYTLKDGRPLSTTLTMQAERIDAGYTTEPVQESASFIYHCYEGKGRTIISPPSGKDYTFSWTTKDTFAVPAWSKIQHINDSETPAYLVAASDRPFLDSLGLRRPTS